MAELPFTAEQKHSYLVHTYAQAGYRYWDSIPKEITDNFAMSEDNAFWRHSRFLTNAERALSKVINSGMSPEEQRALVIEQTEPYNGRDDTEKFMEMYGDAIWANVAKRAEEIQFENELLERYLTTLQQEHPNITFSYAPTSTPEDLVAFVETHGENVEGDGIFFGEYAVAKPHSKRPVIATDFLMDCISVILVSHDPEHPENRTAVISHIDITTNMELAINTLLGEIPEGNKVSATLFGSDRSDNTFMNTEAAHYLVTSGRISSLATNIDGPTTIAVHAPSGTILAVNDPDKGEQNAYEIGNALPVSVHFDQERSSANFGSYRDSIYMALTHLKPNGPHSPNNLNLPLAIHPDKPSEQMRSARKLFDNIMEDKQVTEEELRNLARDIGLVMDSNNVQFSFQDEYGPVGLLKAEVSGNVFSIGYVKKDTLPDSIRSK